MCPVGLLIISMHGMSVHKHFYWNYKTKLNKGFY